MNMIKKEKRMYEKPTWGVIEMRQRMELLVGSLTDPSDYPNGGDPISL